MAKPFENRQHLVRVALLFISGFAIFWVLRGLLVPADFGVYGHFRAGALQDNRERAIVYAGQKSCADCHSDAADLLRTSRHGGVGCEACHGPLADHVQDPAARKAERPGSRRLCLHCHEKEAARPSAFPQIVPGDHAPEGACTECHRAHAPKLE
jgi:hypothetical protein